MRWFELCDSILCAMSCQFTAPRNSWLALPLTLTLSPAGGEKVADRPDEGRKAISGTATARVEFVHAHAVKAALIRVWV
jgi:hypothetical protein